MSTSLSLIAKNMKIVRHNFVTRLRTLHPPLYV